MSRIIELPDTIQVPHSQGDGAWTVNVGDLADDTIVAALTAALRDRVRTSANRGLSPTEYVAYGEKAIAAITMGWSERTRTTDAVTVEARKVAEPAAKARLSIEERKDAAKVRAMADKLIAKNPAYRHLAEKRLAEAAEFLALAAVADDVDLADAA